MTHAPIGSSSGLLHSLDTSHPPHRRVPAWLATATGLSTSLLLHGSILVVGVLLLREVPNIFTPPEQDRVVGFEIDSLGKPPTLEQPDPAHNKSPLDGVASARGVMDGVMDPRQQSESFQQAIEAGTTGLTSTAMDQASNAAAVKPLLDGNNNGTLLGVPTGPGGPINFLNGGTRSGPIASRVVFLCDGTGTMLGLKFDLLKRELKSTVASLKPTQEFNVVLFASGDAQAMSKTLTPGTNVAKRRMDDFLQKFSASGATNPLPGIDMAFMMKPEVIFLLSDGEFDNVVAYADVVARINELNPGKKVKVYTILFGDRDDRAQQTLKTIASDNGGTFRFVRPEDLLK